MEQISALFRSQRYTKCLKLLKKTPNLSLVENFSWQNNLNSVEFSLEILSGKVHRIQNFEEDFLQLLQKIRCIPTTELALVVELGVICNIITCHLLRGFCSVDQSLKITIPSLKKCWNYLERINKEGTGDTSDTSADALNLMEKLMNSDVNGPLGHSLVETCLRLAAVLLLNGQQDKASQCLTLCDYQLQAKVQEEALPNLLIPLELCLLGGDVCSPETSTTAVGHLLCGLCLYPEESDRCKEHMQQISIQSWMPYTNLMEAQLEYRAERYMEAMILLSEAAALPFQITSRLRALHCHLFGRCLSKLNKPHVALQKFREALDADFSYLMPLYNISTEYKRLGMIEAELESLNLLVTAVESKEVKEGSMDSIFYQRVTDRDIGPIQSLYYLAQACELHGRFDIATEKYVHLISLLNSNTREKRNGSEMLSIPSISEIYRSAIACLLKAKKYQQCEILCERVLSCQPTSVLDLSSILSLHSQEDCSSQGPASQSRACMGSFSFVISQSSDKELSVDERKECSQGKRKRLASEEITDLENEGQMEKVIVHLYKAEAQIYLGKIEEAIASLDIVLEGLRKSCLSTTQPLIQTSSQESKRQRLSSDGAAKAVCPTEGSSFWKDIGHQASHVYQRLGVSLCRQSQLMDSLHFLRLSLQLDKDNPAVLYNCTVVLWKLGRQREAIKLWCKGRQLDTQTDSFQMAELIQQKKASLQGFQDNDLPLDVKETLVDEEAVQLDVQCLEFLIRWRRDR
uniref:Uncharacterized protein LOC111105220 n=1 Tax=Crassostrea virginica TaxID=6565 RepID=A0A8B8AXS1_CRAVI|nr:uncharacterized protein LOC111105220 [Crassostrea virginica]